MKLLLIALILLCTMISSALADEEIPHAFWGTPLVDGETDDCWADAPVYTLSGGNTTEEAVNVKLLADAIGIYLRLQSEEARTAFIGRYYFLDPIREVADYCGITESKAKTLLHRTRQGLKEYLKKEGYPV